MRGMIAGVVLVVSGCQCFDPVGEGLLDAGHDAGVDAGSFACTAAADCKGASPIQSFCPSTSSQGYSCIDHRCIYECTKGRACVFDAGTTCLECGATAACLDKGCGMATMQGQVESTNCSAGFTDVMLQPKGGCQWDVTTADGGVGRMSVVSPGGGYVGVFDGLGTCVGVSLQTQVERVVFSCEGCQFVLRI